jgi:ketosteroid isomerase-like protein
MRRSTLELVREAYEAYNRRDVAALQDLSHEQCVICTVLEGQVEPQPFRGHDGIRAWIDNENELWESLRIDELELTHTGGDRVETFAVASVRGKQSGMELRIPVWSIIDLRDGKIFRLRSYATKDEADEAAQLGK